MKNMITREIVEMDRDLIISDLDGTLTSKSLVLEHFGHLIEKGIVVDNGSYEAWTKDVKNEKLIVECAMSYQRAITGINVDKLDVRNFVTDFISNDNNWYLETLEMLEVARDFGNTDIVLITGSADFLVEELAEQLGFDFFATIYKRDIKTNTLTGEIVPMFGAEHKSEIIEKHLDLHLYNEIIGLGDTSSDYGIFKHCQTNILVHPTKETLEHLILKGTKIDKIIK